MRQRIVRQTGNGVSLLILAGMTLLGLSLAPGVSVGQTAAPTTHTIFLTGLEVKGGTTADKLAPPAVNPKDLSKGYDFKKPGEADKQNPQRWEVSSYMFSPGFVAVRQGDTVKLTVFIVNGDKHEVSITAPDGRKIVADTVWNRGREYQMQFVAEKAGPYQLICSEHAPSMITTFLALPR
jgi:plastocyanin